MAPAPIKREVQGLVAVAAIQRLRLLLQIEQMHRCEPELAQRRGHCCGIRDAAQRQHGDPAVLPLREQRIEPDFEAGPGEIGRPQQRAPGAPLPRPARTARTDPHGTAIRAPPPRCAASASPHPAMARWRCRCVRALGRMRAGDSKPASAPASLQPLRAPHPPVRQSPVRPARRPDHHDQVARIGCTQVPLQLLVQLLVRLRHRAQGSRAGHPTGWPPRTASQPAASTTTISSGIAQPGRAWASCEQRRPQRG